MIIFYLSTTINNRKEIQNYMLGGYQIFNLTNIDLTVGTSQVSITDKEVLDQLRNIRDYIEEDYNFAKPLNRKLKPVLLRLRDKKNGEKQEISIWANMSIITNNKTFKIEALVDSVSMKAIQIEVVFQQLTDDDGNKYWDIKTAKYLLTDNVAIKGDLTVTGAINGEENPSVKPIYYHPISIWSKVNEENPIKALSLSLVILGNKSTSFTLNRLDLFIQWCRENNITYLAPVSGFAYNGTKQMVIAWIDIGTDYISIRGHLIDDTTNSTLKSVIVNDTEFGNYNLDDTGVNKIN